MGMNGEERLDTDWYKTSQFVIVNYSFRKKKGKFRINSLQSVTIFRISEHYYCGCYQHIYIFFVSIWGLTVSFEDTWKYFIYGSKRDTISTFYNCVSKITQWLNLKPCLIYIKVIQRFGYLIMFRFSHYLSKN